MRTIDKKCVRRAVEKLIGDSLVCPDKAVTKRLETLSDDEPLALFAAKLIAENNRIAARNRYYACQDTGQAVLMVKLGDGVVCEGLYSALNKAVKNAYAPARKSVADPLTRKNTGDNTPPIIEVELCSGDELEISFLAKGAGSENMSALCMLKPADGEDGIVNAVVNAVRVGGKNACPPLIIGVGIGGVTETCCSLSKRALLRPLGEKHSRSDVRALEERILKEVNDLKVGVAGFGGKTTALAVNIEVAPTHIGMLPVAVNLQCHSLRHGVIKL